MKTIQLNIVVMVALFALVTSCVKDDDYGVPPTVTEFSEPDLDGIVVEVSEVVNELLQAQDNPSIPYDDFEEKVNFEFEGTQEDPVQYMTGYVVSSDLAGNFFEELIIQDLPENPTVGIRVLVDQNPLWSNFEFGRKVYVNLQGLSAGVSNGVIALGVEGAGPFLEQIPGGLADGEFTPGLEEAILRSPVVEEIVPLDLMVSEFADNKTNLFIRINNVQFNRFDVLGDDPLTFAGEPTDEFDGERIVESCDDAMTTILATSTFAKFKSATLPSGSGSISGVLTKNFFGDEFNLAMTSITDLNFDSDERCDPIEIVLADPTNCDDTDIAGSVLFAEDFESLGNLNDLTADGWTIGSVVASSVSYTLGSFDNNFYAQITGFNSDDTNIDSWLITPALNLNNTSEDELNLDIQANFDNGEILTILVSTNFSGNIAEADWSLLEDANIPQGPSGTFGDFEAVGPINLSCIDGDSVHIAFRYQGSDPSATTRYHIDNVEVSGN
ncbi:hypothetical protein GCM10009117_21090 [Gangjinia marincola]|uniref:DUF5689 domain-containing protein n=1 Tax=Gangjinia marincola TaxID=578463 RepID=A0ABN1MIS8_9FLAO